MRNESKFRSRQKPAGSRPMINLDVNKCKRTIRCEKLGSLIQKVFESFQLTSELIDSSKYSVRQNFDTFLSIECVPTTATICGAGLFGDDQPPRSQTLSTSKFDMPPVILKTCIIFPAPPVTLTALLSLDQLVGYRPTNQSA